MPRFLSELRDERRLSASTLKQYECELGILLNHFEAPTNTDQLRLYLRELAPATALRKLIIWKSFLAFCGGTWEGALDKIPLPKLRQKQPLFLTEQEAFTIEHACYRSDFLNRDRLLVGLMLQLGLRLAEVLSLRFSDFEGDWLRLIRKGGAEQRLPVGSSLKTIYEIWKNERRHQPQDFVFEGRGREVLTPRGVQNIIERLRKAAKIEKKITPHALRHTFASSLAAKGASLAALKEILGHRKITTTERYLHVTPDHLRDTLNLLK